MATASARDGGDGFVTIGFSEFEDIDVFAENMRLLGIHIKVKRGKRVRKRPLKHRPHELETLAIGRNCVGTIQLAKEDYLEAGHYFTPTSSPVETLRYLSHLQDDRFRALMRRLEEKRDERERREWKRLYGGGKRGRPFKNPYDRFKREAQARVASAGKSDVDSQSDAAVSSDPPLSEIPS